ncbi:hypothetical protein [Pseudomonas syringae]|uniref:hypothetical protein n=1 Tax=Pseudomonas syringae TaxID=317 RepID=UPI001F302666|nr:hypothetical protein [Pseudomonas syringae]MCF5374503.1 hypothetical protein [Pseudomonas syringae]
MIEDLIVSATLYQNLRIAIRLTCEDGEQYSVLTSNLVEAQINDDEVCISSWNHPADLLTELLATGRFEDTGELRQAGYADAPVWGVKCPELLAQVSQLRAHAKLGQS